MTDSTQYTEPYPPAGHKKSTRRAWLTVGALGILLVGIAIGSASGARGGASDVQAKVNSPATTAPAEPERNSEPPAPPKASGPVPVGQAFTWEDGLSAIVTGVKDGNGASYDPMPTKEVTVQVQNGTADVIDLSGSSATLTFGPAGQQANRESWYSDNLAGFTGSVPPGGTVSAVFPFSGVTDASTLMVEFAPTYNHQSAFWKQ